MSTARDAILTTLRRQLKRGSLADEPRQRLQHRLQHPPRHTIPQRGLVPHSEQVNLFIQMAERADASVQRLSTAAAIPAAVADYLHRHNLPSELIVAPDPSVAELPWSEHPSMRLRIGAAQDQDKVSVSPAFAGIAETGTLMVLSGAHTPTTLNFLPDAHIVVLPAPQIVGCYEEAWQRLREHAVAMPRTANLITGPSRSADIEQTLQLGAHGPIHLHIVIVDPSM